MIKVINKVNKKIIFLGITLFIILNIILTISNIYNINIFNGPIFFYYIITGNDIVVKETIIEDNANDECNKIKSGECKFIDAIFMNIIFRPCPQGEGYFSCKKQAIYKCRFACLNDK